MHRLLSFLLKSAVSVLLLYLAFRSVDLATLQDRLSHLDPKWIAAALVVLSVQMLAVSLRWQQIAGPCGTTLRPKQALLFTLIGTFFNQALPSTVGGDAARIWLLARQTSGWKSAVYSVLIDRAVGLIWLAIIVLLCLPWSLALIQNPPGRVALILIGSSGVAAPLLLLALTHTGGSIFQRWRLTRHLAEIAGITWMVLVTSRVAMKVAGLTIAVHLTTIAIVWFSAKAIGSPLGLLQTLILVPPVVLVAAIPLSIAGWGVREGAMVIAFTYAGLPQGDGLIVSLLFGVGYLVVGIVGGVVWTLGIEHFSLGDLMRRNGPLDR